MPSKPLKTVICNTTILSNFAAAGQIHLLLNALERPLATTPEVIAEISAGVQAGYSHLQPLELLLLSNQSPCEILSLDAQEVIKYRDLRLRLHAGEASCLAIAIHRDIIFGTDDLAARKIAKTESVQVIGTVGALVATQNGLLTLAQANAILKQMIDRGYRSPVQQLDAFWK